MNPSLQSWENGKKVANGQEDCLTIEPTNPNTLFQKKHHQLGDMRRRSLPADGFL